MIAAADASPPDAPAFILPEVLPTAIAQALQNQLAHPAVSEAVKGWLFGYAIGKGLDPDQVNINLDLRSATIAFVPKENPNHAPG